MRRVIFGILFTVMLWATLTWAATDNNVSFLPETNTQKQAENIKAATTPTGHEPEDKSNIRYEVGTLRVAVFDGGCPAKKAEVFFNGRLLGEAPYLAEGMRPGEYPVKVTFDNKVWAGTVKIEPGKITAVDVIFKQDAVSAEIYKALLWEDFLDNRNNWSLKPGSLIHGGRFIAKTPNVMDFYLERNHTLKDFVLEAAVRVQTAGGGLLNLFKKDKLTDNTFGIALRVKGSASVLLLQKKGRYIRNYYLLNFDDIEYYSNPVVLSGELKVPVDEWFRLKVILRQEELQVFIDGKLVTIIQVKYSNEGNFGLVAGPGTTLEVEYLTVGEI